MNSATSGLASSLQVLSISLPPGWASRLAGFSAKALWKQLRTLGADQLVVTTPHYLELARKAAHEMPVYYYCSDDYSSYDGWGGEAILEREAELIALSARSFFVSHALARRAIDTLGADPSRVSVSPNATDAEFLSPPPHDLVAALVSKHPRLARPIVGVFGALNDRIDYELLAQCAERPECGSLLFVGAVAESRDPALAALRRHPKCVFLGHRPHSELRTWMHGIDVALIPYRETQFNQMCSPMRLFDHLAAGRPLVATSACEQVREHAERVVVAEGRQDFLDALARGCLNGESPPTLSETEAESLCWSARARVIDSLL